MTPGPLACSITSKGAAAAHLTREAVSFIIFTALHHSIDTIISPTPWLTLTRAATIEAAVAVTEEAEAGVTTTRGKGREVHLLRHCTSLPH